MRLDYSDKVGALREKPERKPLPKNRPRKAPVGIFAILSVLLLLGGVYGAGVFTGWYLFRGEAAPAATAAAPAPAVKQQEPVPAAQPPAAAPPETPLTFYKTLPSGGHGAMGSGVNLKIAEPPPQPKAPPAAPTAAPAAAPAAASPSAAKPALEKQGTDKAADKPAAKQVPEKQAPEKQASEKGAAGGRFLVQVASYKEKSEADAVLAKLSARGVAAYIVESRVQDKGVFYRLRAGRHLSRDEAEQLARKVGGGAAVLPE